MDNLGLSMVMLTLAGDMPTDRLAKSARIRNDAYSTALAIAWK
jgi:hypothetical protein